MAPTGDGRVVLFDPETTNEFGRELARLLVRTRPVTLYCSHAVSAMPAGVRPVPVLASSRAEDGLFGTGWRRGLGAVRAGIAAARGRHPLVVVWTRHAWEAVAFAFVAVVLRVEVVVVGHNPRGLRPRPGLAGVAEALLKRVASKVVVLAEELRAAAEQESANVWVAPHPSYAGWRARHPAPDRLPSPAERSRVLFLGSFRPDKGFADLPGVVGAIRDRPVTLVVAGRGAVPPAWRAAVAATGVELEIVGGDRFVDDDELAAILASVDVMVAPYVGATQSGSLVMALTCGVPAVAYAAAALPSLLTARSLTPVAEPGALGARVAELLADPWPTWRLTPETLDDTAAAAWQLALTGPSAAKPRRGRVGGGAR